MSFGGDVKRFNKKAEKVATRIFRGTALSLFGKVITRTPVDTGRLRGNWQATLNTAASGTDDNAYSQVGGVVESAKLGDSIFLVNNLPYAQVIENGSSKQAPAGMVNVTVTEFKQAVRREAGK